jgi:hypothetical protein
MKRILMLGMLALPRLCFAATDCHIVEMKDHFEAVCVGDAMPSQAPARAQPQAVVEAAPPPAPISEVPKGIVTERTTVNTPRSFGSYRRKISQ